MIAVKEASDIVKRKYPNRRIMNAMDYDRTWWLFEAVESDTVDYNCPLVAVNKNNGEVRTYALEDIGTFMDAYMNRSIKI